MNAPQAILIMGGMFNLMFSTIAAFLLYWVRLRNPGERVPHYGLITHTSVPPPPVWRWKAISFPP